jgi:death-on-curing protein
MISIIQVEQIHKSLIDAFGGADGTRDLPGLESALARPFQTFDGNELYPDIVSKTAALIESLLINHPFIDGNKRTAYVVSRILLRSNKLDINASQEEKYQFVVSVASGKTKYDEIVDWLNEHVIKIA